MRRALYILDPRAEAESERWKLESEDNPILVSRSGFFLSSFSFHSLLFVATQILPSSSSSIIYLFTVESEI